MKSVNDKEAWAEAVLMSATKLEKQKLPSGTYAKILSKIHLRKAERTPLRWVQAAAAVFLCLISLEIYLTQYIPEESSAEFVELIPENNNSLYDE